MHRLQSLRTFCLNHSRGGVSAPVLCTKPRHRKDTLVQKRAVGSIAQEARKETADNEFKATIGLELHAQLAASQKLFSAASAQWNEPPNTNVCAIDAGLPGALPQLNPRCVELAARAILAFGGRVQQRSSFDRKHYFYADQPLGYQITQQHYPIGRGGYIQLGPTDGLNYSKRVHIHQLQLEQDTAKSIHGVYPGYVLVDLNRAGVALIEIVSDPDIETAIEASTYVRKMQTLLRHIGVSNCNMEEGSLRCDVNVSVYRIGEDRLSGARCELKNLNSLKTIRGAIGAEIARQTEIIRKGGYVEQETRGYDARCDKTYPLRSKETAPDYRYMPEPDVPEIHLSQDWIERVQSALPEMPEMTLARVRLQYSLTQEDVATMLNEPGCLAFFEESVQGRDPKRVSSWITSEIFGQLSYRNQKLIDSPLTVQQFAQILDSISTDLITSAQAKQLLIAFMDGEKRHVSDLIKAHGWEVIGDESRLQGIAEDLLEKHPKEVAGYLKGQTRRLNFFVGKLMQLTKGQAKPQEANRIIRKLLESKR